MLETLTGTRTGVTTRPSSRGQLYVVFTSDSSVNDAGFEATYATAATPPSAPSTAIPAAVPTASPRSLAVACSGTTLLTSASGRLSDGAGDYAPNSACSWVINAPGAITLTFSSIALEANYDFVKVYRGATSAAPLAESLTGHN